MCTLDLDGYLGSVVLITRPSGMWIEISTHSITSPSGMGPLDADAVPANAAIMIAANGERRFCGGFMALDLDSGIVYL